MHREWVKASLGEKDLGAFVDKKLNMNQHCVLVAQKPNHLSCITSVASRSREGNLCPCSGGTPPVIMHPGLAPHNTKKTWTWWN